MKREERQSAILNLLYQQDRVDVDELATHFDVSAETIRRDLNALSEQGLLRKVHGGAVRFQTAQENTFALRTQVNRAAKHAIGEYTTRFLDPGDSLFINAGTTTLIFAEHLTACENLTIITNCASVANTIWTSDNPTHKVYLLGGEYNGDDAETYGPLLLNQLKQFQADHAIFTIGALDAGLGLMEYRVEAAEIIRVMIEQARKATALVDSSKIGKSALAKICDFTDVHRVITENLPSQAIMDALQHAGTQLHVANLVE